METLNEKIERFESELLELDGKLVEEKEQYNEKVAQIKQSKKEIKKKLNKLISVKEQIESIY